MSLHVSLRSARNFFAMTLLTTAVCAVQANAQEPPKAPAKTAQAPSGKAPAVKTTPQPALPQAAPAAGVVVFVDPSTGKIRQPDAAEIGALTGNGTRANSLAAPVMFAGPGGSVGIKLGDDSLSFMVVTRTPDGKLAEDCVTGDKPAAALVSKGVAPKTTAAPKKISGVPDDK